MLKFLVIFSGRHMAPKLTNWRIRFVRFACVHARSAVAISRSLASRETPETRAEQPVCLIVFIVFHLFE